MLVSGKPVSEPWIADRALRLRSRAPSVKLTKRAQTPMRCASLCGWHSTFGTELTDEVCHRWYSNSTQASSADWP